MSPMVYDGCMSDTHTPEQLVAEWAEMARDLGRQHASGQGSDDNPHDAIDLQAWSDLMGEDMSYGELADVQATLAAAYEEGLEEAYPRGVFTLSIDLGNEAMRSPEDIANALRRVAQMVETSHEFQARRASGSATVGSIMDNNGNTVGKFETA